MWDETLDAEILARTRLALVRLAAAPEVQAAAAEAPDPGARAREVADERDDGLVAIGVGIVVFLLAFALRGLHEFAMTVTMWASGAAVLGGIALSIAARRRVARLEAAPVQTVVGVVVAAREVHGRRGWSGTRVEFELAGGERHRWWITDHRFGSFAPGMIGVAYVHAGELAGFRDLGWAEGTGGLRGPL